MRLFCAPLKAPARSLPLASKKLSSVSAYFGIALNHHHAGSDAEACARIYLQLRALGVTDAQDETVSRLSSIPARLTPPGFSGGFSFFALALCLPMRPCFCQNTDFCLFSIF